MTTIDMTMLPLDKAILLAVRAHAGQVDKGGHPYILHPLRVMQAMSHETERIVAVLHDVMEDAGVTPQDLLAMGFSSTVVEALESVTRREGESYEDFVRRAAANPFGRRVKLADLRDNSDLSRIPNPTERDRERVRKYQHAIDFLERGTDDLR